MSTLNPIMETKAKGEALGERSQIQLNSEKTTELRGSRTDLNSLILENPTTLGDSKSLECGACTGALERQIQKGVKTNL